MDYVKMLKKTIKKLIIKFASTKTTKLIKSIEKSDNNTISFDIFDTLIVRNVYKPTDVFEILESSFNQKFNEKLCISKMRIAAEHTARQRANGEDISLKDIYFYFEIGNDEEKEWLYNKEIELELNLCQRNNQIYKVYKYCKDHGKRVIAISDMYLPSSIINKILESNGYADIDAVYVSSEAKVKKSTGNLFRFVIEKEQISFEKLTHIGDAVKGDFIKPKKFGVHAILIQPCKINYTYFDNKYKDKKKDISYGVLSSFISNNCEKKWDYAKKLGYEVIGPILYGYVKWLNREISKKKIEKIYFLTREGITLKKAYDLMGEEYSNQILWVSRKAVSVSCLGEANNIDDLLKLALKVRQRYTLESLLNAANISEKDKNEIYRISKVKNNQLIENLNSEEKNKLYEVIFPFVRTESSRQRENMISYMESLASAKRVALCDVGWKGTIQFYLNRVFKDTKIEGLYMGITDPLSKGMFACYFDDARKNSIQEAIMSAPDLFERFFLADEGSACSYEIDADGNYYCNKEAADLYPDGVSKIRAIQDGAFEFIKQYYEFENKLEILPDSSVYARNYTIFMNILSRETLEYFKTIKLTESKNYSLVANHGLTFYLIHPQKFKSDFIGSGTKALFLKSILKIPISYPKVIMLLKKYKH